MADEFDLLAAKVLSGEATASERARFEQLLRADPDRAAEFEELRKLWLRVRELAPLTDAWDAPPGPPPAQLQHAWQERVETRFGDQHRKRARFARTALALAAVLVAAGLVGVLFLRDSKPSTPLQVAMTQPQDALRALLISTREVRAFPIYSPAGFTGDITPMIIWKAAAGKTYELSIADELAQASQPLRLAGVTSPVDFDIAWPGRTLTPDGLYRLRISETDSPAAVTEVVFRVVRPDKTGTVAQNPIERAYELLAANPARFGDALAILLTQPPETAQSERALRLKAFAFGQLGYSEEFETALAQLSSRR